MENEGGTERARGGGTGGRETSRIDNRSARSAVRRLPIGKILQFDYNFFFSRLSHTTAGEEFQTGRLRREIHSSGPGRGGRPEGGTDVKLISNQQSFLKAFESAI